MVTGISYDRVCLISLTILHKALTLHLVDGKLNYIHRMMARTCFVLLWIHGVSEVSSYPEYAPSTRTCVLYQGFIYQKLPDEFG